MERYRIAVDTGGTFSDFVVFDQESGRYFVRKVPSTPDDPSRAVLEGLTQLEQDGITGTEIGFFIHGTTVATNILVEEKGARTGLIITDGFRGVYETMEQSRPFGPAVYDITYSKPPLLVPESRTVEIVERIGADGEVRVPIDHASIEKAIRQLEEQDVESVAICLLFSFLNTVHEDLVAKKLKDAHPEWSVTSSSSLLRQIREYYRLSTTAINAYVLPSVSRYIDNLEDQLDNKEVAANRRFAMQSNGGTEALSVASRKAINTMFSGPAGGVTAGAAIADLLQISDVITFDMGGTSCDVALIHDGEAVITDRSTIDGRHIAIPMLDINTVSAGGGTVALVDEHGNLHVGPHSAGADPGPACYGRGGQQATVTDADVVLGYLSPSELLAGSMKIDGELAKNVLLDTIAKPLDIELLRAADGIVRIIETKMANAIKAISTERGFDLRQFTLIPFGGAGPIHACRIASELGIPRVLIPPVPGTTSALGLVFADVKHDYVRSRVSDLEDLDLLEANSILAEMTRSAERDFKDESLRDMSVNLSYWMDIRYAGQGYENPVPVDYFPISADDLPRYRNRFDEIHKYCHGHAAPGQPCEVVNYRVQAAGKLPPLKLTPIPAADRALVEAQVSERYALFSSLSPQPVNTPVYAREKLMAGHLINGPAIVEQYDSTIVIWPEQDALVDEFGNLMVTLRDN